MRSLLTLLSLAPLAAVVSLAACSSVETEVNNAGGTASSSSSSTSSSSSSSSSGAGGSSTTSTSSSSSSGGQGGAGGAAIPYPAKHPGFPEMVNEGGVTLHDPVIVTVTWPNDPMESFVQTFDDTIGGTAWWAATTSEYGVGPATAGGHVSIVDAAPAAMTSTEVEQWILDRVADNTLPKPTDQTIYALYFPDTTTITLEGPGGGPSCAAFGAYHGFVTDTIDSASMQYQYAVVPRCAPDQALMTYNASHEFIEASTDPHVNGPPGPFGSAYYLYGNAAGVSPWNSAGGEDADLCEFVGGTTEGPYSVTRGWSNAAAKIGDQPCVPVAPDPQGIPFFDGAIVKDMLKAHPGDTVTTDIDCYSFGPLPGPITLSHQGGMKSKVTVAFDKTTCVNGDVVKASLTLAATAVKGTNYGYRITATLDMNHSHLWRGMVTAY